jgi:hypothetical protein
MRTITTIGLLLLFSCGQKSDTIVGNSGQSEKFEMTTSIIQLVATPDNYHNNEVSVTGFLNIEFEGDAIYIHKEDYEQQLYSNGLWVDLTEEQIKEIDSLKLNKQYVLLEGTFDKNRSGHMGLWSGEIKNVTRITKWGRE